VALHAVTCASAAGSVGGSAAGSARTVLARSKEESHLAAAQLTVSSMTCHQVTVIVVIAECTAAQPRREQDRLQCCKRPEGCRGAHRCASNRPVVVWRVTPLQAHAQYERRGRVPQLH